MLDIGGAEQAAARGPDVLRGMLIPADRALGGWQDCIISDGDADRFCGGQKVPGGGSGDGLVRVYAEDGRFLGIGQRNPGNGIVAPKRIFVSDQGAGGQ
jgi:hypothetical protein